MAFAARTPVVERAVFGALTAVSTTWLALAVAGASLLGALAIIGMIAGGWLVLAAPVASLLSWLASGPTLATWLGAKLGGGLPALTLDRALLLMIVAATLLRGLRRPGLLLPLTRVELCMGAFVVIAAVSALVAGGAKRALHEGGLRLDMVFLLQGYAMPFAGFWLAKNLPHEARHMRWLLHTLIGVGLVLSLIGILQYSTGITLFKPTRFQTIQEERATGTMASAFEFGMLVNAGLLATLVRLRRATGTPTRMALAAIVAIELLAVVLSKTRAVWVGLLLGCAICACFDRRFRKPVAITVVGAVLGLVAAWPLLAQTSFVQDRVLQLEPIYNRVALTATSVNLWLHHPVFGVGFSRFGFLEHKWPYITSVLGVNPYYARQMGVPHNEFMHVLVLTGLVGFVPYALLLATSAKRAAAYCRRAVAVPGADAGQDLALVCLAVFGVWFVSGMFSDLMFAPQATLQTYVLLGAVDGMRVRASSAELAA